MKTIEVFNWNIIIVYIIFTLLVYLGFVFIFLEINPSNWGYGRIAFILALGMSYAFVSFLRTEVLEMPIYIEKDIYTKAEKLAKFNGELAQELDLLNRATELKKEADLLKKNFKK